jgi:amino acid adenylation domain-containing protein
MSEAAPKATALTPVDFDPFGDAAAPALLPLTEPQAEVWAAVQMGDEASCAYNQCYSLQLRGPLSAESMESALRRVMERHEALRVRMDAEGRGQEILATSLVTLPVLDLSHHSPESRAAAIARILETETTQPLDLAAGSMVRTQLVREAPELHRLILTAHHIVCDGWSSAVLFGDLARIYAADRHGLPAQLPVALSYRDYVTREAARADDAQTRADAGYWAQQYADSIPVLELPLDAPRPGIKTYSGARQELRLDESLGRALKAAGAKHGCTLFVTLLAGFEALLTRLSGQEDFVVGVPMAGQTLLENGHLVGHCVNLIPLRCRIEPAARFVDHLKSVRHAFLDAQSHQQVSFGSLLRKLNVPRDPGRTPLVSVTFNIDKLGTPYDFGELALEAIESPKRFLNFEISINVIDSGRDLIVECEYNTDLFTAATIGRWLGHYKCLLETIALDPVLRIHELPLLTAAERQQLLIGWNETSADYPADASMHGLFEAQAARTPDAVAVEHEGSRLTYAQLNARANQVARYLARHGVELEVMVGLCVERNLDMVVGILGILKAGGAYVPLDPDYPASRLGFMLEDTAAPVLLTHTRFRDRVPQYGGRTVALDADWPDIARETQDNPNVRVSARNMAYVIFTSGSTGRPKGVVIEHRNAVNFLHWAQSSFSADELARTLFSTSLNFDLAMYECFAPLTVGATARIAQNALELARTPLDVTLINTVPSAISALLDSGGVPKTVRTVNLAGEPLKRATVERLFSQTNVNRVCNLYGPSETTTYSTWVSMPREQGFAAHIGRPISNTQIYLLDAHGQPVPLGVVGEIYIGGDGVGRGYLNRPELTAERFVADPFATGPNARMYRTGDSARYLPDGNIEFLGRIDHQVKIRGYRVELGEIEAVLAEHPDVRQAVVHLWKLKADDVRLVACCVPAKAGVLGSISLRKHMRARLPEYMIPQYVLPVDEIPLTPNGKVDRRRLPTPVVTESGIGHHEAPADPVEATIAQIWTNLIGPSRPIGRADRFFEMGGHSLLGLRALRQMEQKLGVKLDFRMLFQESLADIATRCRSLGAAQGG